MTEERIELHLKYRPKTFDELIGNQVLKEALIPAIETTRTFIFYGMRGCGKTTIARLIASYVGADKIDIHEIDAADNTGIDHARSLKEAAQYSPLGGKFKVYIIDECHRLSGQAFDSLLKILENPPSHCYFILSTTEFTKIPVTIRSRAKSFQVAALTRGEQESFIKWVCRKEMIRISTEVRNHLIDCCDGVPREILVSLDTIRNCKNDEDAISLISATVYRTVKDLCQALLRRASWAEVASILKVITDEPESIRRAVLGYMNSVILGANPKTSDAAALIIEEMRESVMYSGKAGLSYACYMAVK